jgi:hypothetical protein
MKRTACLFAAGILLSTVTHAQLFRAYLSSTGSDGNPCTVGSPCRLLPAALAAVMDGGEIWMLDSANYNTSTVTVSKSVTILAIPGAVGSLVSTGGSEAVLISGTSIKVTLRNLVVIPFGTSGDGIDFTQGSSLTVENCEISDLTIGIGINVSGGPTTIRDTVIRNALTAINAIGAVNVAVERVHATNQPVPGTTGLLVGNGARMNVTDSEVVGFAKGINVVATGGNVAQAVLQRNNFAFNTSAIQAGGLSTGDVAQIVATGNVVAYNMYGFSTNQPPGSTASIIADGNVLTLNSYGFFNPSGTIYSRGTNTAMFNGQDTSGAGLTAQSGI